MNSVDDEDLDDIRRAIEKLRALSPRQAELVELRLLRSMTLEEAAARVGVGNRTAKSDTGVALAFLRKELGP